jgi:hypothetical protein
LPRRFVAGTRPAFKGQGQANAKRAMDGKHLGRVRLPFALIRAANRLVNLIRVLTGGQLQTLNRKLVTSPSRMT